MMLWSMYNNDSTKLSLHTYFEQLNDCTDEDDEALTSLKWAQLACKCGMPKLRDACISRLEQFPQVSMPSPCTQVNTFRSALH